MASNEPVVQEAEDPPHANMMSFFNNVPETNLSTSEESANNGKTDHTASIEPTLGLNWEMGVATLPGSDIQFRLDENGDVEVLSGEGSVNDVSMENSNNNNANVSNINFHVSEKMSEKSIEQNPSASEEVLNCPSDAVDSKEIQKIGFLSPSFSKKPRAKALVAINSIAKCEFCNKVGRRRTFMGRFCSKVCIARHAVEARKQHRSSTVFKKPKINKPTFHRNSAPASFSSGLKQEAVSSESKPKQLKSVTSVANPSKPHFKKRSFYETMSEIISDVESFDWERYLSNEDAKGLDCKLFEWITGRIAYPTKQHLFKEGQILEVVDPFHQSLICLASIVQVEGVRLRMHFQGYYDCYDFWVDADSPFIFPCGFCEKTGRQLCGSYDNIKTQAHRAVEEAFPESIHTNATQFKIGDKLEAVDRKHHDLICVATVTDIIGEYVLIHFDGWEKDYDYWAVSSSPFIHPIGWCGANDKKLSPPPNHVPPFVWSDYLKSTGSLAADASCFKLRNGNFEKGMKLEVVDPRNAILVRAATIVEVNDLRLKVHFDGWSTDYDDWLDVDSRDIHPINWCQRTSYPLHPPVDDTKLIKKSCPVKGCPSLGHMNSPKHFAYHKKHYSEHGCPYSAKNMKKNEVLYDRFALPSTKASGASQRKSRGIDGIQTKTVHSSSLKQSKKRRTTIQYSPYEKHCGIEDSLYQKYQSPKRSKISHPKESKRGYHVSGENDYENESSRVKAKSMQDLAIRSSVVSSIASLTAMHLPHCWNKNVKHLPGVDGVKASDVMKWDIGKVAAFVTTLTGKLECGNAFEREEVDGEALLLLSQNDILNTLKLKLGPAVKIYNAVLFFKVLEKDYTSLYA